MNSLPRAKESLYFQNVAGKVFHHPSGYARLAWGADRPTLEHIKAFYEQVLALLLNTNTRKILSDHGQRAPLPAAVQSCSPKTGFRGP